MKSINAGLAPGKARAARKALPKILKKCTASSTKELIVGETWGKHFATNLPENVMMQTKRGRPLVVANVFSRTPN